MKKAVKRLLATMVMSVTVLAQMQFVYAQDEEKKTTIIVDDKVLESKVPPVVADGYTLVPVRALSEALGFQVAWDDAEKKITLIKIGSYIEMRLNSMYVNVNGTQKLLDAMPRVIDGSTMIPIRFVSEGFGMYVTYDETFLKDGSKGIWITDNFLMNLENELTYAKKTDNYIPVKNDANKPVSRYVLSEEGETIRYIAKGDKYQDVVAKYPGVSTADTNKIVIGSLYEPGQKAVSGNMTFLFKDGIVSEVSITPNK